jgi:catechol 2,3-dioxygenase-like lactoylglutathione lyase family enzyme
MRSSIKPVHVPGPVAKSVGLAVATSRQASGPLEDAAERCLTEPEDHGREIRAYLRDPDGHLIEVGQFTGPLG